jgi:hypothetical protein
MTTRDGDYENPWTYNGKIFTSDDIEDYVGFVYIIHDLNNDKSYVGKKTFVSKRKLPPLKGKTRKRIKVVESDWKDYYGSSEEVQILLEKNGVLCYDRKILHLCKNKGVMSYLEAKEQFDRGVLLSDKYYNGIINCKIHRSHVKELKNEDK